LQGFIHDALAFFVVAYFSITLTKRFGVRKSCEGVSRPLQSRGSLYVEGDPRNLRHDEKCKIDMWKANHTIVSQYPTPKIYVRRNKKGVLERAHRSGWFSK
jgi:hypothetical protein